jgi:hypothetical protein
MMRTLKDAWKGIKRKVEKRRELGVVDDPLPHRVEAFVRHKLLQVRRIWLAARTRGQRIEEPPVHPIFILGCPRSGTTLLFRLLQRHKDIRTPGGEGHILWNKYQHPKLRGWNSDRLFADDVQPEEPVFLYTAIRRFTGDARFLDKTPRNCLRVPYLARLFPDATFVLLKRNGPPTVSSLIEGWHVRHGVSYRLPFELDLDEYQGNRWCYMLPPGWQELRSTNIARIAAQQYVASYETALDDLESIPANRVVTISYEDLVAQPTITVDGLLRSLDLPKSGDVTEMASDLSGHQVQTNSPPRPDKWRARIDEIREVMPLIAPTMKRLGYDDDLED